MVDWDENIIFDLYVSTNENVTEWRGIDEEEVYEAEHDLPGIQER